MNVITICNPYPELILLGEKPIENRTQRWNYRGELLIHAGKSRDWMTDDAYRRFPNLVYGAIVGSCRLGACLPKPDADAGSFAFNEAMSQWFRAGYIHLLEHEHANGPWCLILENVKRFARPIPARGALGLWQVPADVQPLVREQLKAVA